MTATHTVLNGVDGRITALEGTVPAPSGTKMLFAQSAAPTGWTKDTTHNDKTIRVVTGTASSGGSNAFSSAFSNITPAGTVATSVTGSVQNHTLTVDEIPSHTHTYGELQRVQVGLDNGTAYDAENQGQQTTSATGGGQPHSHGWNGTAVSTFTGNSINLDVQYVDVIICTKN